MKYIVGLKYTNPAHEHVSLRRRVESRNTVVEAASEQEAILRASRQQRALGFTVREAGIVQPQINESVEQVNEARPGWMLKHPDGAELAAKLKAREELERKRRKAYGNPSAGVSVKKEEVEQVDEGYDSFFNAGGGLSVHSNSETGTIRLIHPKHKPLTLRQPRWDSGFKHPDGRIISGSKYSITQRYRKYGYDLKEKVEQIDETRGYKVEPKAAPVFKDTKTDPSTHHFSISKGNKEVGWLEHDRDDGSVTGELHGKPIKFSAETDSRETVADRFHQHMKKHVREEVKSVEEAKGEPPAEFMPSDTKLPRIKVPPKPKGRKYYMPVKPVLKGSVGPAIRKEEVEQVEEAKKPLKPTYWRAEWRLGTQSEVDKNNKKIYDKLAKTDPVKAQAFHDNLLKMRKEEVDADKRDAGYKMSPAVKAAQAKFDAQARAQKMGKKQAGTLAAKKERVAQKMIDAAKGNRNKVNMEPSIDVSKGVK